ncbi:MAG TPA: threonine synthase [Chthoniobacterales bacterium]|nr:threonine synthase [Chthoniobacterales bacterium]
MLTHLECALCGKTYPWQQLQNVCTACGRPLLARYETRPEQAKEFRASLPGRWASLWRYRELLPLPADEEILTLGEGWTPLLPASRLAGWCGLNRLWIKDESQNPTGSFKARGMAVAVAMAKYLGAKKLAVPSAGNAAGALAAYSARAGLPAYLFMPKDTPQANIVECQMMGAHITLVDGLITDCGREIALRKEKEGWFDLSTLKEPYRVEGKKTLGYEIAEQLGWKLPDVIIYPTGGGTGLIGMWKAFSEMTEMGWINAGRPRMVAVQAAGCQPIVSAFVANHRFAEEHRNATTKAAGLRVPKAIADFLILDAIRLSHGTAVAVSDEEMLEAAREIGRLEGIFVTPEGGACYAALKQLQANGQIQPEESVVLFNTASGLKYLECFGEAGNNTISQEGAKTDF